MEEAGEVSQLQGLAKLFRKIGLAKPWRVFVDMEQLHKK